MNLTSIGQIFNLTFCGQYQGVVYFCILLSNPALQNFSYKSIPSKFLIDFLYDKKPDRMNTTTPIANITNCPRLTLEESFKLPKPGI